ncbi:hypothetical protein BH23PLA1_BH23PLA1_24480 [soil metagenome]
MTEATSLADKAPRPEPTRMTLADLLALVVGVAIVAALPWLNRPEFIGPLGGGAGPASYVPLLMFLHEGLGKACLALVPVVLARRVRHGGMVRPTEFLLACVGLPWLSMGITTGLMLVGLSQQFGRPIDTTNIPVEATTRWVQETQAIQAGVLLTVGLFSAISRVVGRRQWPGWFGSVLLMVVWTCALGLIRGPIWHGGSAWQDVLRSILGTTGLLNYWGSMFAWGFGTLLPIALLYAIPVAAVAFGLRHRSGLQFAWHERAALLLASAAFLAWETAMQIIAITRYLGPGEYWSSTLGGVAAYLTAALFGLLIIARWLPGWSRRAGVTSP